LPSPAPKTVCGRRIRDSPQVSPVVVLAATDPANPYGAALDWPPAREEGMMRPQRAAGARVVLGDGHLIGYLGRTGQHLLTFLPENDPERTMQRDRLVAAGAGRHGASQPGLPDQDRRSPSGTLAAGSRTARRRVHLHHPTHR
jgi:hypothetical protein